jgi:hypothetical protein
MNKRYRKTGTLSAAPVLLFFLLFSMPHAGFGSETGAVSGAPLMTGLFPPGGEDLSSTAPDGDPKADKLFFLLNEGLTASKLTRIIKQSGRSNFVFEDFMTGLYFGMETVNLKPLDCFFRFSLYYPLSFTFNKVPQIPKNIIRYASDLMVGPVFNIDFWRWVQFNLEPALHLLYQNSDRWNYINLGIAGRAGLEVPLFEKWTVLLNGVFSFDYGNLGSNAVMEPYDIVYQYQIDFGIRYSKRQANTQPYVNLNPKPKT